MRDAMLLRLRLVHTVSNQDLILTLTHLVHLWPKIARRGTGPITPAGSDGRRNTVAVYSQEFQSLEFFWGVDSSAARPGRAALE
jgi:hypothetical protein